MKRVLLRALGIFLTIVGISKNPTLLIFPMWIFTTEVGQVCLRRCLIEFDALLLEPLCQACLLVNRPGKPSWNEALITPARK